MNKYIDADRAKNGIMKFVNENGEIVGMFVNDFNILLERCAADVQEVRHGRWDFDEYGWVCSVCESPISVRYGKKNYCPNCGAKMDGDTE